MSNWFGNLQLAYKYVVVFLSLLALTMLAGFVKVFFDRRKLKMHAKKAELETGQKEDTVELNQREKDEGDLFGIRAIEAGFYAGVAQSRPTSRAGSVVGLPNMSSSTLVGNPNSPLLKPSNSTNSIPLATNRSPSPTLPGSTPRTTSPNPKLRPSEAELNGRHTLNDNSVDMSLNVPPSPGFHQPSQPTFGSDSDSDDNDFRSMSPGSADFNPKHYKPAPSIPMPDALRVSYHDGRENVTSQVGSINNASPLPSPGSSTSLAHPGAPPETKLPTIPQAHSDFQTPTIRLDSAHHRDTSDASSVYSNNRMSTYTAYQNSLSQPETSKRMSVADPRTSTLLAPQGEGKDARLSEFYEAYYRQSQILGGNDLKQAAPAMRQSTIMEDESSMASPLPGKSLGTAV